MLLLAQNPSSVGHVEPTTPQPTAATVKPNKFRAALRRQPAISVNAAPKLGVGVSVGCFAGTGYGLAVGIGSVTGTTTRNTALIVPSFKAQAFAHDGAMVGAFCGVVLGGGFATGIGAHFGFRFSLFDEWFTFFGTGLVKTCNSLTNRFRFGTR